MTSAADMVNSSSRARIGALEQRVSDLCAVVKRLEQRLDCTPTEADPDHSRSSLQTRTIDHGQSDDSNSSASSPSDAASLTNPPTHLLHLFDNGLLDSQRSDLFTPPNAASSTHTTRGFKTLLALMPSREDMLVIIADPSSWLSWYDTFFPIFNSIKTGDEMLSEFDNVRRPDAKPVSIAVLLLSIAITIQQAPQKYSNDVTASIRNAVLFIKEASDVVERLVVFNDDVLGTLEGITCALLFLRL